MRKAIIVLVVALLCVFACDERSVEPQIAPQEIDLEFAPDGGEQARCVKMCWNNIYRPCLRRNPDDPNQQDACLNLFLACCEACFNRNPGNMACPTIWDYLRWCDRVTPACPGCKI